MVKTQWRSKLVESIAARQARWSHSPQPVRLREPSRRLGSASAGSSPASQSLSASSTSCICARRFTAQGIENENLAERAERVEERRLWEYQIAVAKRESAANAVGLKVFGGAFTDAMQTGQFLPLSAIMARQEMEMKAANLHVPLALP